jgi:hypothetical protein
MQVVAFLVVCLLAGSVCFSAAIFQVPKIFRDRQIQFLNDFLLDLVGFAFQTGAISLRGDPRGAASLQQRPRQTNLPADRGDHSVADDDAPSEAGDRVRPTTNRVACPVSRPSRRDGTPQGKVG